MKAVVWIAVLIVIGAGGWMAFQSVVTHDGYPITIAFGFPDQSTIEVQIVASMAMSSREPPRIDPTTLKPLWEEWVEEHFVIQDAAGNRVRLGLRSHSDMIPKNKVKGTPEGYLAGRVQRGVTYTFDYIPFRAESKRYRHEFVAPNADTPAENIGLLPA